MTNHETPAEMLAEIARRIVDNAMPATDSGATCFVPRYQIDQLSHALEAERSLAAGKVVPDDYVLVPCKPTQEMIDAGAIVICMGQGEDYTDDAAEAWAKMIETAPPADPAKASGSAPEVTEQVIERVAIAIARRDIAPWFDGPAEEAWPHARESTRDEYRVMARNAIDEFNAALQEGKSHG